MFVEPCPKCGRLPKIVECCVNQKYKNGIRRRLCECPNLCSVIPCKDGLNHGWFEFDGDGDANVMYRQWNLAIMMRRGGIKYERNSFSWSDPSLWRKG